MKRFFADRMLAANAPLVVLPPLRLPPRPPPIGHDAGRRPVAPTMDTGLVVHRLQQAFVRLRSLVGITVVGGDDDDDDDDTRSSSAPLTITVCCLRLDEL